MYDHELEEQRWKLHFTTTNYMHVTSERKSVRSGVLKAKGLIRRARWSRNSRGDLLSPGAWK